MILPMPVEFIVNTLEQNGYEAYVVGGCVRDSILKKQPKDWDICTSALPEQIIEVFKDYRIIPTGIKHGTVTVCLESEDSQNYEVTTFRTDGEYSDSRHPDSVEFVDDIYKDLARRDFTINAMAYNHIRGFIDPFNGLQDLKDSIIRCVNDPNDRFNEDALRMLRALRFALTLQMEISEDTFKAIIDNNAKLKDVSTERISAELYKILDSWDSYSNSDSMFKNPTFKGFNNDEWFELSQKYFSLLCAILGFLFDYEFPDVTFNLLSRSFCDVELRLAILYKDSDNIESILKKMKYSNEIISVVKGTREIGFMVIDQIEKWMKDEKFIAICDLFKKIRKKNMVFAGDISCNDTFLPVRYYCRKLINDIHKRNIYVGTIISYCEILALWKDCQTKNANRDYIWYWNMIASVMRIVDRTSSDKFKAYSVKYLAVNGNDLIDLGLKGKEIGEKLNELLECVYSEKLVNERNSLINYLTKQVSKNA